ncbi:MAG: VCBS repeat-containing protein [Anaerolineae bacterium]|nr:VCBS repeat-containing protein [Phycisphaerae bacterium]
MRWSRCLISWIACAIGSSIDLSSAHAAPPPTTFRPRVSRAVGVGPLWTACADFNGDGRIDVAMGRNGGTNHAITTFYTQPDGTLPLTGTASPTAFGPSRFSSGDFNADGRADLLYFDDPAAGMKLTFGQTNNAFGGTTPLGPAFGADFWGKTSVGDLNHDGRLDAMMALSRSTSNTGGVATALALPGGGFQVSTFQTNSDPHGIANADLDGNGYSDVIIGDESGGEPIRVAYGSSSGTYTVKSFAFNDRGYGVVARDFNGDGRPDVAAVAYNQNKIGVMLTQPNGDLGAPSFFTSATEPYDIAAGDFNGDGIVDLVSTSVSNIGLIVHPGNGDGTFAPFVVLLASAAGTSTVSVGDLDGNGYDDIAVAAASGQNLDIFYAVPEPASVAVVGIGGVMLATRRRRPRR